jgi:hypothetical protein
MSQLVGLPTGTYAVQVQSGGTVYTAAGIELGGTATAPWSPPGYQPKTGDALQTWIGAHVLAITHVYNQGAFQPLIYNPGAASFTCNSGIPYASAQLGAGPTSDSTTGYAGDLTDLHFAVAGTTQQNWIGWLGWTLSLFAADSDAPWGESALQELGSGQNGYLKITGSPAPMPWIQVNQYVGFGDGLYWRVGTYRLYTNMSSHNNCSALLAPPGQLGLQVTPFGIYAGSPAMQTGAAPVYAAAQTYLTGAPAALSPLSGVPSEIAPLVQSKFYQPLPLIATLQGAFPVTQPLLAPAIPVDKSMDALAVWQVTGAGFFLFSPRWPAFGVGCCIVQLTANALVLYTDTGTTTVQMASSDSGPNAYAWLYMHDMGSTGYVVAGGWSASAFVQRPGAFLSEKYWLPITQGPLSLGTGGATNYTTLTAYQAVCQMNRGGLFAMDVPSASSSTPYGVGVAGSPQGAACDKYMSETVCGNTYNPQTCCVYTSQLAQAVGGNLGLQAAACFQSGCAQTATAGSTAPGTGGSGYIPYSVTTCIGQTLCLNVEELSGSFNTIASNQTIYCGGAADTTYIIYIGVALVVGAVLFWLLVIK